MTFTMEEVIIWYHNVSPTLFKVDRCTSKDLLKHHEWQLKWRIIKCDDSSGFKLCVNQHGIWNGGVAGSLTWTDACERLSRSLPAVLALINNKSQHHNQAMGRGSRQAETLSFGVMGHKSYWSFETASSSGRHDKYLVLVLHKCAWHHC
jgi:hypothetical protein